MVVWPGFNRVFSWVGQGTGNRKRGIPYLNAHQLMHNIFLESYTPLDYPYTADFRLMRYSL